MGKRVKVPISAARARLFQLTDLVRAGDDTVVVLEQRGGKDNVALVRESRLAYLEARAADAEQRDAKPFRLAGSIKLLVSPEELEESLRESRREWDRPLMEPGEPIRRRTKRRGAGSR
jgi:PHD/YefM family antitoxin component YafN of YafNO toxin-antitoxin module